MLPCGSFSSGMFPGDSFPTGMFPGGGWYLGASGSGRREHVAGMSSGGRGDVSL